MRNRIPSLFLSIVLLLLASSPASASEEVPVESFVDRIDVEIVNVEVFVTDRDGRRVTGLKREDFELYEDGKPVEITNFYAMEPTPGEGKEPVTDAAGSADETRPVLDLQQIPQEQKLSLMVFFDHFNIRPNHRTPVLKALREFLDERLAQGDRIMLVAWNGAMNVVQPFTEDPRRIVEGIRKIGRTVTRRPEQQIAEHLAKRWDAMDGMAGMGTGGVHMWGRIQESRVIVRHATAALEDAARLLGPQPGRKAILYVSDGLPPRGLDRYARHLLRRVPDTANAHLVTFYALDARGAGDSSLSAEQDMIDAGGNSRTVAEASRDWNIEQALYVMSAPTGGSVLSGTSNFPKLLRRLGEDFDLFYSLGYASRNPGDGKYHTIKVKLRRPGLSVRHRNGYLEKPPAERVADHLLASLMLDRDTNPLGIRLALGEADKSGSKEYELPILVRIPSGLVTFLRRDEVMESRLRIYLAVQDEQRRFSLVREVPYPLSVPLGDMEKARDGDIGYQTTLRIRSGSQKVAVGVWDEISGAESFVHETVVVGEPESAKGDG